MLTLGLVRSGIIKFQVFPNMDGFVMTATAEFPAGTPPEITRQAIEEIETALLRLEEKTTTRSEKPLLVDRLTLVGQTLGDMPEIGTALRFGPGNTPGF
jgi:hypothetical protein